MCGCVYVCMYVCVLQVCMRVLFDIHAGIGMQRGDIEVIGGG